MAPVSCTPLKLSNTKAPSVTQRDNDDGPRPHLSAQWSVPAHKGPVGPGLPASVHTRPAAVLLTAPMGTPWGHLLKGRGQAPEPIPAWSPRMPSRPRPGQMSVSPAVGLHPFFPSGFLRRGSALRVKPVACLPTFPLSSLHLWPLPSLHNSYQIARLTT